jgi:uncharacterized protein YbjT (DUF2867 family)
MINTTRNTIRKTVVVAGATGRAGRCIIKELLHRGYRVRALLVPPFDPPKPSGLIHPDIELVQGNLDSTASLEMLMESADYVISAIGSKKPFSKKENNRIDNLGNQNIARAAKSKGLQHMVVISSTGVGNSRGAVPWLYRIAMGPVLRMKEKSENFIRTCGITYTIIRPGGYTEKELPDAVVFGEGGKISGLVKREHIARVCVDALSNQAMKNRTFEVVNAAKLKEERRKFVITV